jgi:2-octaprenyl-6-methoxyphenol hydroxylase
MASGHFDIAIVGGGIAGYSAAVAAAQSGRTVALIRPVPTTADGRSTALLSGSVDFLDRLGLWPKLTNLAQPLSVMRIVDDTNRLIRAPEIRFSATELGFEAFGQNIANRDLNRALHQLASEVGVEEIDGQAETIALSSDRATVDVGDKQFGAGLLIGADGRNSTVRRAAHIAAQTKRYPQHALVVDLAHQLPHGDVSTEFHTTTGPFTLVPMRADHSALVCVVTEQDANGLLALDNAALEEELERRAHHILGRFTLASAPQVFPLSTLLADQFDGLNCLLIGEAAHVVPPIGAQGFNMSLADVAALQRYLETSVVGDLSWLAAYSTERRQDVQRRHFAINLMNQSLLDGFMPIQLGRGLGVYALKSIPALRKALMRQGMGQTI